ncbi:N-acetyltransferase [Pyrococcus sp. ST04]|uniref:GNAT family N-acetyltransferase n=1 Tax=Pyrococcus sp. ST04 TaxID=1183377 RepID=UPI00064EBC3E|nr:GNAT family N-acetyltransferase [Pyrococcus sp. ST04]
MLKSPDIGLLKKKIVLHVEKDNEPAISLYRKLGYSIEKEYKVKAGEGNYVVLYRMPTSSPP